MNSLAKLAPTVRPPDSISDELRAALAELGITEPEITELAEYDPDRVDAVQDPANGTPWLLMKQAGRAAPAAAHAVGRVLKTDSEKRFTLAVAYPADKADANVAFDGARDFASATANEAAAWRFMKNGARIGLLHQDGTEGAGTCVESHVHRGPDITMTAVDGSTQTNHDGDWLVGVIWDQPTWAAIKSGRYKGVSMQGSAVRRKPSPEALAVLRKARAKGGTTVPKALRKAVRAAFAEVTAEVATDVKTMSKRLDKVEKQRGLRCAKCAAKARAGARFCTKCGRRLGGKVAKSAAGTPADARLLGDVITKARRGDQAAVVRLVNAYGAATAGRLVDGSATL